MALESGSRLGPYEITALIGIGVMGEVYRATDTKLGRSVAIKTLPSELANDADRLARFEREARLSGRSCRSGRIRSATASRYRCLRNSGVTE